MAVDGDMTAPAQGTGVTCRRCGENVTRPAPDLEPGENPVLVRWSSIAPGVLVCHDGLGSQTRPSLPMLLFSFEAGC